MKNYLIVFFLLFLYGCKEDIPGQLTIVQGTITDYLTGDTLKNIPLLFVSEEPLCFSWSCDDYIIDTFYSDNLGKYAFEFYNDSNRWYFVVPVPPDGYSYSAQQMIREGESNKIDFCLKQFIKVNTKLINKPDDYNAMFLYNHAIIRYRSEFLNDPNKPSIERIRCYGNNCDTILHIIPDDSNYFQIRLWNKDDESIGYTEKYSKNFYAGVNDTTFIFYY